MIRIKGHIPKTKCATCRSATLVEGEDGEPRIYCHLLSKNIRFRVTDCGGYRLQHTQSLFEMKQIGWILDSSPRQIGFMRPGTAKHKEAKEEMDLDD